MSAPRRRLAVLMAAHNRRALTLRAIVAVRAQAAAFAVEMVLLDDGSTDGTADAVREVDPATIILAGDGTAFWNGGMYAAWHHALTLPVDGFLWLNDDVALDRDALARLAEAWAGYDLDDAVILVGATRDAAGAISYSGMVRRRSPVALAFDKVPPEATPRSVETFNGNIVLISRAVVDRVGINDPGFLHGMGDIDYGLRAGSAGVPIVLLPGTLGVCENNPPVDLAAMTLRQRWRHLRSHRGIAPRSWWRLTRRHSGIWFPLHFALPYRRVLLPGREGR